MIITGTVGDYVLMVTIYSDGDYVLMVTIYSDGDYIWSLCDVLLLMTVWLMILGSLTPGSLVFSVIF